MPYVAASYLIDGRRVCEVYSTTAAGILRRDGETVYTASAAAGSSGSARTAVCLHSDVTREQLAEYVRRNCLPEHAASVFVH